MPTHGPGHLKTFDYIGLYRYFLTFCCHSRRCLFTSQPVVGLVLSQILHAANDERFALVAYCFMPDHVHLLVEALSESSHALRFIARAKQRTGFSYAMSHLRKLRQRYGYESTSCETTKTRGGLRGTSSRTQSAADSSHGQTTIRSSVRACPRSRRSSMERRPAKAGRYTENDVRPKPDATLKTAFG